MKVLAIASAIAVFASGCFACKLLLLYVAIVYAALVKALNDQNSPEALKQLMVVVNKESFVARDYGTFSLPKVKPSAYVEPASEVAAAEA
ncbi:hypothetical protein X943_003179 [Babesia divergens]|uniref:Uncharacterized protein n=1 Tax=Babesia divergens TaxID=32595 RepID=A0AAD9LEH2_BABDI|nr:hypothetical protein X943_003179 [Babesia divergens]